MIPVTQTKFGSPHGNCFMACIASILEISLEECPDISEESTWWGKTLEFLRSKGWTAVCVVNGSDPIRPPGYHIASGMSARGLLHSCVALDGHVVHDPHPDRTGIDSVKDFIMLYPLGTGRLKP